MKQAMSIKLVPIEKVKVNVISLRDVDQESVQFQTIVESIKQNGFIGAITGRNVIDPESKEEFIEVIDGLQRFTAAKAAGITEIPIDIKTLDDNGVLFLQIAANQCRVDTKPIQYTRHLRRILVNNEMLTIEELAKFISQTPQWIKGRLQLLNIDNKEVLELIDTGKIGLSNATVLARLPQSEINNFLDSAVAEPPKTFIPKVTTRIKEINDAKRKGNDVADVGFSPQAYMRKLKDISTELETNQAADILIKKSKVKDPVTAFNLGIKYCINLDPESVKQQEIKFNERQIEKEEKKKKAKVAREAKKKEALLKQTNKEKENDQN